MKHIILVFLLISIAVQAQTTPSKDVILWNKDKQLVWEDFKSEPIDGIGIIGEAYCMIIGKYDKPNINANTIFNIEAIFDRNKSWILKEHKTEQTLMFFQVMFNLYELHARKLRSDLVENEKDSNPKFAFQQKYDQTLANLSAEFNEFRRETKLGTDLKNTLGWKLKVDKQLLALKRYQK